ncbi:unnamed protein product [Closterium sp. Yama58-4]|nr:unnamed protein product [Closterium sp. Yama58-4]
MPSHHALARGPVAANASALQQALRRADASQSRPNTQSLAVRSLSQSGNLRYSRLRSVQSLAGTRLVNFISVVAKPTQTRRVTSAVATTDASTTTAGDSSVGTAVENLVIIGSGPAGYTAAIYAARANLKPVLFEGVQAGGVPGGQLMTTTEVENFPGFPEGITGPDLMIRMRQQAERWGAELHTEDVEFVDLQTRPFTVRSSDREVRCHSVIIATGATARRLGLPSEKEYWSRGISACAICDGASPIFKGQELAVVGGGDTAVEEALYLTKYAKHVHLLVRRDILRASKAMQDRVFKNPNVTVHLNTIPVDVVGNDKGQMAGLNVKDAQTGQERIIPVKGLFYGIGHKPNSDLLAGQVELDGSGYVMVKDNAVETSVPGVFAAGDLKDHEWRQAITAAASGCMAALSVERYLTANDLLIEFHQKEVEVVEKKELTEEDVEERFDPLLTRHKGQYALRKLYHESSRLIGVIYTSPTCGPCRTLKPMLAKVVEEFDRQIHWVEIDIEEDPEIAEAAGIMGTPVVHFFKNKEKINEIKGVKMKRVYREFIEANK